MKFPTALICGALALSGCAQSGPFGASASAELKPSRFVADEEDRAESSIGIIGGGLVAGSLGSELSRKERRSAIEAEYRALESTPAGEAVAWGNGKDGRSGEVVAAQPYRVGSQDCRQYAHKVEMRGETKTAKGTACRNEDGSWTLLG